MAEEDDKNEVIVTENTIIITFNEKQKKEVMEQLRKSGKAKFKIDDIEIDAIPCVRSYNKPIHQDP